MASLPPSDGPARHVRVAAIIFGALALIGVGALVAFSISSAKPVPVMQNGTTMPMQQMK